MNHTDILIHFAKSRGFRSYLEIGVQDPNQNYLRIPCEYKCGVDPDPLARWNPVQGWMNYSQTQNEGYFRGFDDAGLMVMTSDEFFKQNGFKFDLIFIDGDHTGEQTYKDILNASKCLSKEGLIVVHDCLPETEEATEIPRKVKQWNGTAYSGFFNAVKFFAHWFVINTDFGIGVIHPPAIDSVKTISPISFSEFKDIAKRDISISEWKKQEGI